MVTRRDYICCPIKTSSHVSSWEVAQWLPQLLRPKCTAILRTPSASARHVPTLCSYILNRIPTSHKVIDFKKNGFFTFKKKPGF